MSNDDDKKNVRIDKDLHKQLKQLAVDNDETLLVFLDRLIKDALENEGISTTDKDVK